MRQYEGGYTDYMEALARENSSADGDFAGGSGRIAKAAGASETGGKKKATWDKGEKKLKFTYKEQKEFETIEDDIAALESKLEELDGEMAAHASQYSRLTELAKEEMDEENKAYAALDPSVLAFLESHSYEDRLNILASMHDRITDDMINTMAVAIDVEIEPGDLEQRYMELKNCLLMKEKFERVRLR